MNCYYRITGIILISAVLAGCAGVRKTPDGTFMAHAESFRVLGYSIPYDDQIRAEQEVPSGGKVVTVDSTPADWTSVTGIIGNLLWPHQTRISGVVRE